MLGVSEMQIWQQTSRFPSAVLTSHIRTRIIFPKQIVYDRITPARDDLHSSGPLAVFVIATFLSHLYNVQIAIIYISHGRSVWTST